MAKKGTFYPKTAEEREAIRLVNTTGNIGALNQVGLKLTPDSNKSAYVITRVGKIEKPKR